MQPTSLTIADAWPADEHGADPASFWRGAGVKILGALLPAAWSPDSREGQAQFSALFRAALHDPAVTTKRATGIFSVPSAYTALGVVNADDPLMPYEIRSEDSVAVRECLATFGHLGPRLAWLPGAVAHLWPRGLRQSLRIEIVTDPDSGDQDLLVVGESTGTTPAENAEGIAHLYDQLYDHFGPWPDGIGFAILIVDPSEDP